MLVHRLFHRSTGAQTLEAATTAAKVGATQYKHFINLYNLTNVSV